MAKSDIMRKRIAALEAQLNGKDPEKAVQDVATPVEQEPKKPTKKASRAEPVMDIVYSPLEDDDTPVQPMTSVSEPQTPEPKPVQQDQPEPPVSEPQVSESEPVQQDQPEPQSPSEPQTPSEPPTPDELRAKAERMEAHFKEEMERIEAEKKAYQAKIQALKDAAEAAEKAAAEEKARIEEEARKAKELERARAEEKARAKKELQDSISNANRHVGKAYKWWDYTTSTWNLTSDVWVASESSDEWRKIYVWYKDGQIERLLTPEETKKYCPH